MGRGDSPPGFLHFLAVGVPVALVLLLVLPTSALGSVATSTPRAPVASGYVEAPCQKLEQLPSPVCHVITVFLENQLAYKVMQTPYEGKTLIPNYAYAGDFYSIEHDSFPSYLAATAGYVTKFQHVMNRTNVVDLIRAKSPHLSWDAYMGGMIGKCNETVNPDYRTAHNPFGWYADIRNNKTYCAAHDVNMTYWNEAVAANQIPNYVFISPNVTDDCWKYGVKSCDLWLSKWLPPLMNTSWWNHTAMFITYDESILNDTRSVNGTVGGGHVYTILVSPFACKGYISHVKYDHYDLLTTTEWLLGLGRLAHGHQDNWTVDPPMQDLFCWPNGSVNQSFAGRGTILPGPVVSPSGAAPAGLLLLSSPSSIAVRVEREQGF
jgi:hypothetical protein